ncbi:DapH/DapD/GlmU-related protein [Corynebacterium comes]|uniref:2,3,4,5-tetrahydropyridine-2,6-dicarboxylate N-succinyltransferase n=1 Tax=Corynebacterium comes TaxID=2675218 RepID=A0A6B8WBQ4_9CORY|nr:DapH/DapD/GlmU-related protein [Corynebacterium comes]QGU04268.1 2,3,4,5-tetrahydropyridine-2,6-dicarboxylate N-succinyltransferase [Corynebacterium comes]
MTTQGATAVGIANIAMDGTVLDTWYPEPELIDGAGLVSGSERLGARDIPASMLKLVLLDEDRMVEQVAVRTTIADLQASPIDAHDVYLRLHLLSHRLVRPLELNMDGALRRLTTVVWTNKGPCTPDNFEFVRTALRSRGLIHVYGIEKLPRMVDYVVPSGVNIAEAERVRLGAYLAPGTRVLREGYVSFNCGTLGAARIEGRLSSAMVVGEGCDIGLSSTVMARRRADGQREPITIGENCIFGVSSGALGLSIGDNCTVGSNIILEKDTQIWDADAGHHIAAAALNGQSNWTVSREVGHPEPVLRHVWQ